MTRRSSHFAQAATNRKTSLIRRLRVEPLEDRRMLVAYTVDSLDDADDGDPNNGSTSLREAVNLANANAGLDDINFDLPAGSTITLTSTQLNITDSVNIDGPGADFLTIDASGADPTPEQNNTDGIRIFNLNGSDTIDVAISGLTLTGGDVLRDGGAIYNNGENLTITDSTISGNASSRTGGGLSNFNGNLTITDSTISENSGTFGGGVYSWGFSKKKTISNSTISDNTSSSSGGGLYLDSGTATITDTTISGNTASSTSFGGGGVYNRADTTITGSTISGNHAVTQGGGIYSGTKRNFSTTSTTIINSTVSGNTDTIAGGGVHNNNGLTDIKNSTITNNTAPDGAGSGVSSYGDTGTRTDISGSIVAGNTNSDLNLYGGLTNSFVSLGNNLLGNDPTTFAIASDIVGVDPQLGPLQDNGGPTWTHALDHNSPAVDAIPLGTPDQPTEDQRGVERPQRGGFDIGSFEFDYLVGDLNRDDSVDNTDLAILLGNYGTPSDALLLEGDLDHDGLVGLKDLLLMKKNFGSTISAPTPPQAAATLQVNIAEQVSTDTDVSPNVVIHPTRKSKARPIPTSRAEQRLPAVLDQAIESIAHENVSHVRGTLSRMRPTRRARMLPIEVEGDLA